VNEPNNVRSVGKKDQHRDRYREPEQGRGENRRPRAVQHEDDHREGKRRRQRARRYDPGEHDRQYEYHEGQTKGQGVEGQNHPRRRGHPFSPTEAGKDSPDVTNHRRRPRAEGRHVRRQDGGIHPAEEGQPGDQQDRRCPLGDVDEDHRDPRRPAEYPDRVGPPGIARAVFADIFFEKNLPHQDTRGKRPGQIAEDEKCGEVEPGHYSEPFPAAGGSK